MGKKGPREAPDPGNLDDTYRVELSDRRRQIVNCVGEPLLSLGARFESESEFGFMPTVSMTADFLAPAPLGAWVEGRTDLLRATRNFLFVQCLITSNGAPALRASGIMKSAGAPAEVKGLPNLRALLK